MYSRPSTGRCPWARSVKRCRWATRPDAFITQAKAVTPCSVCGRFVCALCDVALNDRHLCPACFEKGKSKRKIKSLENHRTCYDQIALMVATVPLLVYFITLFTAPLTIYLIVRHWNTPGSIISRTKVRFILAFILAGLQITAWILFFSNLALST